jgi:hypothetical protein
MGVGDILDETFQVYRRHFVRLVMTAGVVAVPTGVLSGGLGALLGWAGGRGAGAEISAVALGIVAIVPLALVAVLAYLAVHAAICAIAAGAIVGRQMTMGEAYGEAIKRLPTLLGGGLLIGLAVGLLSATGIGIPVAIYLFLGWTLFMQAVLIEGRGVQEALGRSRALVGGQRWRVLGLLIVMGLLTSILQSMPTTIIGGIIMLILGRANPLLYQLVSGVLNGVAQALFYPLAPIASTLLYYELRVRKEAFDLEQRLSEAESVDASSREGGKDSLTEQPPLPA